VPWDIYILRTRERGHFETWESTEEDINLSSFGRQKQISQSALNATF